jgi:preprotein translocase SecF subunit
MKDISLIRLLPETTTVPFIAARKIAAVLSVLAMIASVFLFATKGLNYGIDFTGGTVIEIDTGSDPEPDVIRETLTRLGYGGGTVQNIAPPFDAGVSHDYVRVGIPLQEETEEGGAMAQQEALRKVVEGLTESIGEFNIRNQDVVGSKVSGELRQKGIIAVLAALTLVLIYIWFRFEWQFGAGAVAALFHDVLLTIGVFSLTQIEFNLSIIAAILTIVGYSLNDTVIVYDRIRENLRKYKSTPLPEILNLSVNDTLSRTIMTSMTTLLALVALYVLGGDGLRGFSFAMIWGVIVGTYSSIFVASPMLMLLKLKRGGRILGDASTEVKA